MDELLDNGKTMQVEHQRRVVKKSGEFPWERTIRRNFLHRFSLRDDIQLGNFRLTMQGGIAFWIIWVKHG